jgi:glycosyltransferase involved in cell wall biosynthesis
MISIIVPVFHNEDTLLRCLESVNKATEESMVSVELAVIFDGPNSRSRQVLEEFTSSELVNVRVVEIPRAGIAAARNAGVDITTSSFITFLDADDELVSDRLVYAELCHPGMIAFGRQELRGSVGVPPGLHPSVSSGSHVPYITSMVVARETLRDIGPFQSDFRLGDDWDLIVRARRIGIEINHVEQVWVIRHVSERNASTATSELAGDYLAVIRNHINSRR